VKVLVIDIETTGFDAKKDAIVEIGMVLVDTKELTKELIFDKIVLDANFSKVLHKDSWIFENTNLTPEEVSSAETLESYREELQSLFNKYRVTAYNKPFDMRFMEARGFKIETIKCLMDSCYNDYNIYGYNKYGSRKRPSAEEAYNIIFPDADFVELHRGGDDALRESEILLKLCEFKKIKDDSLDLITAKLQEKDPDFIIEKLNKDVKFRTTIGDTGISYKLANKQNRIILKSSALDEISRGVVELDNVIDQIEESLKI